MGILWNYLLAKASTLVCLTTTAAPIVGGLPRSMQTRFNQTAQPFLLQSKTEDVDNNDGLHCMLRMLRGLLHSRMQSANARMTREQKAVIQALDAMRFQVQP